MAYNEKFRNKVRTDWAIQKYRTITELAEAHGLPQRSLISTWIKKYDWAAYKTEVQRKADEKTTDALSDQLSQVNQTHFRVWQGILGQVVQRMQRKSPSEPPPVIDLQDLTTIAGLVRSCQSGQRLAIGADREEDAGDMRDIEISFGGLQASIEAEEAHNETKKKVQQIDDAGALLDRMEVFDPDEEREALKDIL